MVFRSGIIVVFLVFIYGCNDSSNDSSNDDSNGNESISRSVQTTRCIDNVAASYRHEFQCDGLEFKVLLTQQCIDQPCGLIFDVHGWGSNADEQEGRSNLASAALDEGGFIVVQPQVLSRLPSWDESAHYEIVFDFMRQAMEAFDVNRDRIHFTGFSQGGFMTWSFVCEHSDVIASAAPIAAQGGDCFREGAGPVRKVPIFLTSGTGDLVIPYYNSKGVWSIADTLVSVMYDYGMVTSDSSNYDFSATGDVVVDEFGRINDAADSALMEIVDGSQDGGFLWTRYTDINGLVFEHLRHANNHVYPDNPDSLIFPEEPSVWFTVGDAILQFFIQNPRNIE